MTAPYRPGPAGIPGSLPSTPAYRQQQGGMNTGPQSPLSSGASSPGLPSGISSQQANAIYSAMQSNPDLAGIIQSLGGDIGSVVGAVTKFLPHTADGSINWGAIGSDIAGFIKNNASTIVNGLSAYNQYQRQQQSDKYAQQALNGIPGSNYKGLVQEFADKQPLRDAGQAGMLNPKANAPNLSNLQTLAGSGSGNPFAKAIPFASGSPPTASPYPPIPMSAWPGAPGGPPFVPTPGVGGDPMAGTAGTVGGPRQPLPISFAPQAGPISAGPQNRPMPNFPVAPVPSPVPPPIPMAGQAPPALSPGDPGGYSGLPFAKLPYAS